MSAVVAAGGLGTRFASGKSAVPKQRQTLGGIPLYMWCILQFYRNSNVSNIIMASHSELRESLENEITAELEKRGTDSSTKEIRIVDGGTSRQESVYFALKHLAETGSPPDIVLVHDAARPFITHDLIDRLVHCSIEHGACTAAFPVAETIKNVSDGKIDATVDRTNLYAAHTPQGSRFDWLLAGHETARKDGFSATDDASILENINREVKIVLSHKLNIKVTVPEDLEMCESFVDKFVGQINDLKK